MSPPPPEPSARRRRGLLVWTALAVALSGCGNRDLKRGDEALGRGRYDDAIAAYEAARGHVPAELDPKLRLVSAHRARAGELMRSGRCDEARPHLASADALTAPLLIDHQQLHECAAADGASPAEQVADLTRLLTLGDHRASILRALMTLDLDLGHDEDAIARLDLLESRSLLSLEERKRLAQVLLRVNRRDRAYSHLKVTVEAEPHDPINRLKLAELAVERGEIPLARSLYEAIVVEFPENPLAWMRLAEFRASQGDAPGANAARARADALQTGRVPPAPEMRPLRKSKR